MAPCIGEPDADVSGRTREGPTCSDQQTRAVAIRMPWARWQDADVSWAPHQTLITLCCSSSSGAEVFQKMIYMNFVYTAFASGAEDLAWS